MLGQQLLPVGLRDVRAGGQGSLCSLRKEGVAGRWVWVPSLLCVPCQDLVRAVSVLRSQEAAGGIW